MNIEHIAKLGQRCRTLQYLFSMIFLLKQDLFIAMEYGYLTIHLLFTFCNIYSVSEHTLLIMMRCASSEHSACQQSGWSSVYIRII